MAEDDLKYKAVQIVTVLQTKKYKIQDIIK